MEDLEKIVFGDPSHHLPKYFREFVRQQYAGSAIRFVHDTMTGEQMFTAVIIKGVKGGGQVHDVVEIEAPGAVRLKAAEVLINIAIPRQSGLVDDDGKAQTGVVLLPPLDAEDSHGDADGGKEIIEEEIGLGQEQREDRDEAAGPLEEVIPAALVQHVLAKRPHRGAEQNGRKAQRAH